jgi:hypothetical protein
MPYSAGANTKSTFEVGPEAHKLFLEFEVNGTIHVGQPVILHSDGNKVSPATVSSLETDIIGVSIHEGFSAYGDYITIACKGYAVIQAQAAEIVAPGAVVYAGYDTSAAYEGNQEQFGGYNLIGGVTGSDVAQVETVTLTGASGTANVTMGGLTKLATFSTDLAGTHAAFVSDHAVAYLAVGITLTGTTTLIFTATVAGTPFVAGVVDTIAVLAGTVVHTTASAVAGATNRIWGWALDAAAAIGDIVRVLIKD